MFFLKVCQTFCKQVTVLSPQWLAATKLGRRAFSYFSGKAITLLIYYLAFNKIHLTHLSACLCLTFTFWKVLFFPSGFPIPKMKELNVIKINHLKLYDQ